MNRMLHDKSRISSVMKRKPRIFHDGERTMLRKRIFKWLKKIDFKKLIRIRLKRGQKWLRLCWSPYASIEKRPVFVVGCNRSGTNMVCETIGKSPIGWDYRESDFSIAFSGYYLREDWIIEWLIRLTPTPIISFGSILDSQFCDVLISRFDGARAIWIYRRYEDVANSCVRMQWGHHLKDYIRWIAHNEIERLGAQGKRLSTDTIKLFGELFREDLSNEECACLYWYMRNQLYFDLELNKDPRVLLLQYEDTVLNKEKSFRRIFKFLGFQFDHTITNGIFASSVGKHTLPGIDPTIREVCNTLKDKLDKCYSNSSGWIYKNPVLLPTDSHEMLNRKFEN